MAHYLQGKRFVTRKQSDLGEGRADVPVGWNHGATLPAARPVATVCVSSAEYESLVQAIWQYDNLKKSLLQIGLNEGTLALSNTNDAGAFVPQSEVPAYDTGSSYGTSGQPPDTGHNVLRTIQIFGIAKGTPLADYLAVVRGGPILDSYIGPHDNYAAVSFIHAAHAVAFFKHVQTHGLRVNQMRARVSWAQWQFELRDFAAERIDRGATRNLVVRQVDPAVTEKSIKEDLDHIHRMVVTHVSFAAGNCYIRTNSVGSAMYARTCMMSRQKFKGSRIDYFPDECAEPIESPPPRTKPQKAAETVKPATKRAANRFQPLDVEGKEE